ncbi:MAG TPA: phosphoribosyltransferase [Thermoplasmata archaeon]
MVDFPKCRRTTWAEADGWADTIADRVLDAGRTPTTIVALTRGGWVPARLVADRLRVKRLVSLRAQHWGVTATPSGAAEITEGLSGPVRDEDVLIVDDITDTGQSLSLALDHVRSADAKRVETATCLHLTHSTFVPTYAAEEIPRDAWVWVVFPWNYWEDLATLARRAFDETHDVAGSAHLLEQRCGFHAPLDDVKAVLSGQRAPPSGTRTA